MQTNETLQLKGQFRIIGTDSKIKEVVKDTGWFDNLIVFNSEHGRQLILDRLTGTNTYSLNITTCGIGTSNTTPAITDTTLGVEVLAVGSPVIELASNVATFTFFFPDGSLADDTYYEVGTYVDGTQLFNHALLTVGYEKTSGLDTTVVVNFTSN